MKRITAVCIRGSDKREAEFDSVSIVVDLPAQQMCPSQQRKMNVEKKERKQYVICADASKVI